MSKPYVLFPYTTDSVGDFFSNFVKAPFIASAVGKSVWSQAAYADGNGGFQLTRAGKAPIAALNTGTPKFWIQRLYHPDKTRALGFGPYDTRVPVMMLNNK
jgi:hypothetical protein